MFTSILTWTAFATGAYAGVFQRLDAVPEGWKEVRKAEDSEPIMLRVALRQQNEVAFEQALIDMSTPNHPEYGNHMTGDQVRAMLAPKGESVDTVRQWLNIDGVKVEKDGEWINFHTTVEKANKLLETTFAWYQNEAADRTILRTLRYSVPNTVSSHIDLVQPTTRFGQIQSQRSTIFSVIHQGPATGELQNLAYVDNALAACSSTITPACLKDLYNIKYTASPSNNSVAFASYLNEYARHKDLQTFESQYLPAAKGQDFVTETVNGGLDDQNSSQDSGEANLDVQYVLGISAPIPVKQYSTGGLGPLVPTKDQPTPPGNNEPYLEFLTYLLAQPDSALPQTLTTSYGEEEQSVPQDYALKVCNLFTQLGARGVSVLFSSGDSGPGNSCVRTTDGAPYFNPTFPAACPYVTSVGATTGTSPERAVGFSSGGFSIYHPRPAYQEAAVSAYLTSIAGSSNLKYFNASNRGFPDVAAQGQNFAVIDKGRNTALSGTSASSPVFAGVVALLNAARRSKGVAPLGFLNPWLYANANTMTDITTGAGTGCTSNSAFGFSGARFNAVKGWDPVTGLGTPKFGDMLAVAAPGVPNA